MRFPNKHALIFINAITAVIFAQIISKSIDIIFDKTNGHITPLFGQSELHFIFLAIFVTDWVSANVKLLSNKKTHIAYFIFMPLLQVVYGYNCILIFDIEKIKYSLLIFGIITILAIINDFIEYLKNPELTLRFFYASRLFIFLIFLIWYIIWQINHDLHGLILLMFIYIFIKILRILVSFKNQPDLLNQTN